MGDRRLPTYAELLQRTDVPPGSAWGLFGPDDELGTVNFLTAQRARDAAACVRTGDRFNLDLPLDAFTPPLIHTRHPVEHHMFQSNPHHRDEYLDNLYTQVSSQIDGLRHMGHPDYGFWGDADPARLVPGDPLLGIHHWANHGIVGRGVLVDVGRYLDERGERIEYGTNQAITVDVVDAAAREQGVQFHEGDIALLRFGWIDYYLNELGQQEREDAVRGGLRCPGLAQSHDTLAWLWDHRFSIVVADNFALEAWPHRGDSPFVAEVEKRGEYEKGRLTGMLHRLIIPLLGMPIGELWWLDDLARACAADGVHDCMVVAKPLNLIGGVGSPANAVAIR